ncbi:MAG: PqqD family protein [Acidimicrobiales bacterium]
MGSGAVGPGVPGVVETEIDGCLALFHPETGRVLVLNATASDIWRLADGAHDLAAVTALLAHAYGVRAPEIDHEVALAVADLRRHGFLPQPTG